MENLKQDSDATLMRRETAPGTVLVEEERRANYLASLSTEFPSHEEITATEITWDSYEPNNSEAGPMTPYQAYWSERWSKHPLNWYLDAERSHNVAWGDKFDWQRFVEIKDAVLRISQIRKDLPTRRPPKFLKKRWMTGKNGKSFEIQIPNQGYYSEKDLNRPESQHEMIHEGLSLTDYDERTHYKFTRGNFEAAFYITKHIWKGRCVFSKAKDNWQYVISPTCYSFLSELQKVQTGFDAEAKENWKKLTEECERYRKEGRTIQYAKTLDVIQHEFEEGEILQTQIPKAETATVEDVQFEVCKVMSEVLSTEEEPVIITKEEVDAVKYEVEEEMQWDDIPAVFEEELKELAFEPSEVIAFSGRKGPRTFVKTVETGFPFRWYPKLERLPIQHAPDCDSETTHMMRPIFTPEEMSRSYFEDLPAVFLRIGRADLQLKCCQPVREFWLGLHHFKAARKRALEPQAGVLQPKEEDAPLKRKAWNNKKEEHDCSDDCVPKVRNKWIRILDQMRNKFQRHYDKMFYFCQRNRGDPKPPYDMKSWRRQKDILVNMRDEMLIFKEMSKMKKEHPRVLYAWEIRFPEAPLHYVEEAAYVKTKIRYALNYRTWLKIYEAFWVMLQVTTKWRRDPFTEEWMKRIPCEATPSKFEQQMTKEKAEQEKMKKVVDEARKVLPPENFIDFQPSTSKIPQEAWQPQGSTGDTPALGAAAPGPSGGGGSKGSGTTEAAQLDQPIKSAEKHTNISFADQREKQTAVVPSKTKKPEHKEVTQEEMYKMFDIVSRPMFIDRVEWKVGDTKGTSLRQWVLPQVYFNASSAKPTVCQALNASYILAMFGSARFNLKVRIQINSIKFQQGRLIIYFKPFSFSDRSEDIYDNLVQYPHVFVDASVSNTTEMTIPFMNVRDAFPIYNDPSSELNYFGSLQIRVWNELRTGGQSSTDASISVYMWLEDLECFQLCNAKDPGKVQFATEIRKVKEWNEPHKTYTTFAGMTYPTEIKTWEPQGGIVEGVIGTATGLAQDIGADLVESLLGKLARGSNSKPNQVLPPRPVIVQSMNNSSQGEGLDLSQRLALCSVCQTKPDMDVFRQQNIKELIGEWSRIAVGEWSVTHEENTRITHFPVTPIIGTVAPDAFRVSTLQYSENSTKGEATSACDVEDFHKDLHWVARYGTMLDYLSRLFLYWRGTLKYKFEVVCTNMHSGRLLIRYEPYGSDITAEKECQKMATPGIVWDVQEQHTLEMEAPYMSTQPWLTTQYVGTSQVLASAVTQWANGLIEMTVINRLKATTGVAQSVAVNVYVSAGDDFYFACPSPLDGTISVREANMPVNKVTSTAESWHIMLAEWAYTYLCGPLVNDSPRSEIVTIDKLKWKIIKQEAETWTDGPMAGIPIAAGNTDLLQFRKQVIACLTVVKDKASGGPLTVMKKVPKMESFQEMLRWVKNLPQTWPLPLVKVASLTGGHLTNIAYDRWLHWYAYALMLDKAWNVHSMPAAYLNTDTGIVSMFMVPVDPTTKEWYAQSKDSGKGQMINPFKGFKPPTKTSIQLFGEDHMDIYKLMKRWNLWKKLSIPMDLQNPLVGWHDVQTDMKEILLDIGTMSGEEIGNYVFETRIPVTPMLYAHTVGQEGHAFVSMWDTKSKTLANTRLPFGGYDGGLDVGSEANLTVQRYLGELFTFWKGSLRYRFTFPNTYDKNMPWWCVIAHHPLSFTDRHIGMRNYSIQHRKRMADVMKMGSVLFTGNVMSNIDVEVPYYNQFSRLSCSDAVYDKTTTNGTLFVYTPIRWDSPTYCRPQDVDLQKTILIGLDTWIWQSVGDDFEYMVKRSAPTQNIWNKYYWTTPGLDDSSTGNDRFWVKDEEVQEMELVPSKGGVVKTIRNTDQINPILSVTKFYEPKAGYAGSNADSITEARKIAEWDWTTRDFTIKGKESTAFQIRKCKWDADELESQGDTITVEDPGAENGVDADTNNVVVTDEIDGFVSAVIEVGKKLPEAMKDFSSAVSTVKEVLTATTSTLESMQKNANTVAESAKETASGVSKLSSVATYAFNATRIAIFFKGLLDALKAEDWSSRWAPIATCALAVGLKPEIVSKAGEWLMSQISGLLGPEKVHEDIEPQAWESEWDNDWSSFFEEHGGTFRLIAAGIATILTFYMTASCPITSKVSGFAASMVSKLRNFAFVGMGLKTLDWMFRWIAETIKTAVLTVADWASDGMVTAQRMSNQYPEVITWLQSIEKFNNEATRSELHWSPDTRMELWRRIDEGENMVKKLSSKTGSLFHTLSRGLVNLSKANEVAVKAKAQVPFRVDPWHFCLTGESGHGKSSIMTFILNFICDELKYPVRNRFYTRSEDVEHWDGYECQVCTLYDDLAQDSKGKGIKELVKLKSNCAFQLPMAALEDKGRCFSSLILGSTTNNTFPRPAEILYPPALWRRRNMLVEIRKITAQGVAKADDWSDLRFDILKPCPLGSHGAQDIKEYIKRDLTISQLLVTATEYCRKWMKLQQKLVASGLSGKRVHVADYDAEPNPENEVRDTVSAIRSLLLSKVKVKESFMKELCDRLTPNQWTQIYQDPQLHLACSKFACVQYKAAGTALDVRSMERWLTLPTEPQEKWKAVLDEMVQEKYVEREEKQLEKKDDPDDKRNQTWYYIVQEGIRRNEHGAQVYDHTDQTMISLTAKEVADLNAAQFFGMEDQAEDAIAKQAHELAERARTSVDARRKMGIGYDAIIGALMNMNIRRKELRVADEDEIKGYVKSTFPDADATLQESVVTEMKKIFNWAHADREKAAERLVQEDTDVLFGSLFHKDKDKYWKEVEANDSGKISKRWEMKFSAEGVISEEEMDVEAAYEHMVATWGHNKIDEMKRIVPTSTKYPTIERLKNFYIAQKKRIQDWFDAHPWIKKTMKLAFGAAALIAGYKLVSWVCPSVMDKIKAAIFGLFGWGAAQIGEERIEGVKEYGRRIGTTVKDKSTEWFSWVKSLMICSQDSDLKEMATDPQKVEQFAEHLVRLAPTVKKVVQAKEVISQPEAKSKAINAYMLGQDRIHAEGTTRLLAEHAASIPKTMVVSYPQGSNDSVATGIRQNVLTSNLCRVMWVTPTATRVMGGLFVKGRVLMTPYHFWHGVDAGTIYCITLLNGITYWDTYEPERCSKLPTVDISVYQCGPRVGQFRDLTKHFLNMNEIHIGKTKATLNIPTETGEMIVHQIETKMVSELNYEIEKGSGEYVKNNLAWEYECPTSSGDCGAILLADNTTMQHKFLGMHVSGAKSYNYGSSAIVLRDEILAAIAILPEPTRVKPISYLPQSWIDQDSQSMTIRPEGNFELVGAVHPRKAVRLPHKTEIQPSAIHDKVREHVTEPSVLTRNDPRLEVPGSPLKRAIEKYGEPTLPFPPQDLNYVEKYIQAEVMTWDVTMEKRKLDDWEAVFGNESIEFCDRMNLSASPGYPYTLTRPAGEKGKAYLFDTLDPQGIANSDYRHQYNSREELAKQGIRKMSVWTDCLKDERRKLEKIRTGKTRAFMLPPADFVQLCRKYFMSFCVCFYSNNVKSFSAVGIDPYSFHWTMLVRKLRRNSNLAFAGDFHSFDGILDPDIIWRIGRIINNWYCMNHADDWTEQDDIVREVLLEEMIHTVHICKNGIYADHQGNPSGNPLTVILNTFAHCFYIRLSWIGIARERAPEHMDLYSFSKSVSDIYYGDDGLYTVKYNASKWFNCKTVSEYLSRFHIEYTDEAKSGELYGVKDITECTFLKNGFSRLGSTGLWLAPISQDTIYELTNWVKKSDDPILQLRENIEDVSMFSFHWGFDFYETVLKGINAALIDKGLKSVTNTYGIEREKFLAKCRT